ncbi:MAG TPA: alpha/beta hydrolase [Edaphocola sp.]|nr:alpha/beta hydrolase [Edaphocola sp.]
MQQGTIKIEDSSWNLIRMGNGKTLLFLFHNIDQSAIDFLPLEQSIGHQYTLIAIDLPGFGKSEWHQKKLSKKSVIILLERLKLEFKADKINIAGIGIGSLYVMMLLEQRSEWIEKAMMIDPHGLKRNSWETALLFNLIGRWKVKKAIRQPEQYEKILKPLLSWGFIRKEDLSSVKRFVTDAANRNLLSPTFIQHYPLVPETQKVKWNLKKAKLHLIIYCEDTKPFQIKDAQALAKKSDNVTVEKISSAERMDSKWLFNTIEQYFNPTH